MMTSLFAPKIQAALAYRESLGKTINGQALYLRDFDRFCAENHPGISCLTRELAWDWVYPPNNSIPNGVNYRIRAISFLGKYLTATGEEAYVFPDGMTGVKHKFSPHIFTDAELQRLFHVADTYPFNSRVPLRHKIISVAFRLIYTCGLRPNEGRMLKRKNINLDNGEILIENTKFNKERIVVMSDDMLALCRDYARYRDAKVITDNEYFFPSKNTGCYQQTRFSVFFKECWQTANRDIPPADLPKVRIYDLRHRFASTVLNRWVDEKRDLYAMLPYLRAYMGHFDLSATEYYIHLLPENLANSRGVNWVGLESLIPEVDV